MNILANNKSSQTVERQQNSCTTTRNATASAVHHFLERGILAAEYQNDVNIQKYRDTLSKVFASKPVDLEKVKSIIYEFLTFRQNVADFLPLFQEGKLKSQMNWYQESLRATGKYAKQHDMEVRDSNPQWFQINTIPKTEQNSISYKVYNTFRFEDYAFIRYLPNFATKLQELAKETGDPISFKVNNSLGGFARSSDSLVIHCTKESSITHIQDILKEWKKQYKLKSAPRYLGRSEVAIDGKSEKDGKKLSFSELISVQAREYAQTLSDRNIDPVRSAEATIAATILWAQKSPRLGTS
jgi:hypothetical protein